MQLEAELTQLREQAEALISEYEVVKTEARVQAEQLQQQMPDYNAICKSVQELESENALLRQEQQEHAAYVARILADATTNPVIERSQLHLRDKPRLLAARDRILKTWRVAKAPEKKERIKEALDRFIEALDSFPVGND